MTRNVDPGLAVRNFIIGGRNSSEEIPQASPVEINEKAWYYRTPVRKTRK